MPFEPVAILATSEDEEGPIAASRAAAAAWRDELRTVARELGQITGELDRLVADLEGGTIDPNEGRGEPLATGRLEERLERPVLARGEGGDADLGCGRGPGGGCPGSADDRRLLCQPGLSGGP